MKNIFNLCSSMFICGLVYWVALLVACLVLAGCQRAMAPPPAAMVAPPGGHEPPRETTTATSSPSPSPTPLPTYTPTWTLTRTPSATATPSPSPSPTPTCTPTRMPEVVASYPIHGDRAVPQDAQILLVLEDNVDAEKVEASFVFSPTLPGRVSWLDMRRIAFITQELAADKPYAMTFALQGKGAALQARAIFTATFSASARSAPIPILMYHRLQDLQPDADKNQRDWTVSPASFERQLQYLAQRRYHTIDLAALVAYFQKREPLPPRPIIISFDDGYRDIYDVAWPLLDKYGFSASLFVIPAHAGYPAYLNWEQMAALHKAGFYFGSHTLNHQDLHKVSAAEARQQMRDSKALIEEKLGQPVIALSYPLGAYTPATIALLKECGYQAACTLQSGYNQWADDDGLFSLRRIRVDYEMTLEELAAKLPW